MKFRIGDKVRFLNDVGSGEIVRIDQHTIYVLTQDGFEIPVQEKDLVLNGEFFADHNSDTAVAGPHKEVSIETTKQERTESSLAQGIPKQVNPNATVRIMLGIIPENTGPVFHSKLLMFLINDSPFAAYFHIGTKEGGAYYYLSSGLIDPDTKECIHFFDQTSISKISDAHVQLMLVKSGRYEKKEPLDVMVSLNTINFSKESYFRENDYFETRAILFPLLCDSNPDADICEEAITGKEDTGQKLSFKPSFTDTLEVDLHMDEQDAPSGLHSPANILALQMSRFHSAIEEATNKKFRKLVVIHGIGQGILKMQVRKELQEKYPQYLYQDASFKEYGFGATLVYLKIEK
jgi:hypothetical protein